MADTGCAARQRAGQASAHCRRLAAASLACARVPSPVRHSRLLPPPPPPPLRASAAQAESPVGPNTTRHPVPAIGHRIAPRLPCPASRPSSTTRTPRLYVAAPACVPAVAARTGPRRCAPDCALTLASWLRRGRSTPSSSSAATASESRTACGLRAARTCGGSRRAPRPGPIPSSARTTVLAEPASPTASRLSRPACLHPTAPPRPVGHAHRHLHAQAQLLRAPPPVPRRPLLHAPAQPQPQLQAQAQAPVQAALLVRPLRLLQLRTSRACPCG